MSDFSIREASPPNYGLILLLMTSGVAAWLAISIIYEASFAFKQELRQDASDALTLVRTRLPVQSVQDGIIKATGAKIADEFFKYVLEPKLKQVMVFAAPPWNYAVTRELDPQAVDRDGRLLAEYKIDFTSFAARYAGNRFLEKIGLGVDRIEAPFSFTSSDDCGCRYEGTMTMTGMTITAPFKGVNGAYGEGGLEFSIDPATKTLRGYMSANDTVANHTISPMVIGDSLQTLHGDDALKGSKG